MFSLTHLLFAIVIALLAHTACADRVKCSYIPGEGSPSLYGYQSFCEAENKNRDPSEIHTVFTCTAGGVGPQGAPVARYNAGEDNVLEMRACGPANQPPPAEALTTRSVP